MHWLSFFIGMLVGWLVELLIDFLFWRRKRGASAAETEVRAELARTEATVGQLEAQLAACRERAERLELCEHDLQACTGALHDAREQLRLKEERIQALESMLTDLKIEADKRAVSFMTTGGASHDNLQRIEGIGPKIAEILTAHGITTFADLAEADVTRLREILKEAGPRYRLSDPETWPEQARLAAQGDWEGLFELQGQLKGGRHK